MIQVHDFIVALIKKTFTLEVMLGLLSFVAMSIIGFVLLIGLSKISIIKILLITVLVVKIIFMLPRDKKKVQERGIVL